MTAALRPGPRQARGEICRHQLQSPSEKLLKENLAEIAAVADQLPPQLFGHLWNRFALIRVAGREMNRQQFTLGH